MPPEFVCHLTQKLSPPNFRQRRQEAYPTTKVLTLLIPFVPIEAGAETSLLPKLDTNFNNFVDNSRIVANMI